MRLVYIGGIFGGSGQKDWKFLGVFMALFEAPKQVRGGQKASNKLLCDDRGNKSKLKSTSMGVSFNILHSCLFLLLCSLFGPIFGLY
jgi:hypothetical protein